MQSFFCLVLKTSQNLIILGWESAYKIIPSLTIFLRSSSDASEISTCFDTAIYLSDLHSTRNTSPNDPFPIDFIFLYDSYCFFYFSFY